MGFRFWAMVVIATMATLACGSGSASDPTEDGLQSRAESLAKSQSDGKWDEWYKFLSPDSKSECSGADFAAAADFGISAFKESTGLEKSDELEFRVQEVTVQGTQGQVVVDMYLGGELFFDSPNEHWVYADGNWWSVFSAVGCGLPTPTLVPSGTSASDPTEDGLRSRAESQAKAVSDGDWAGWYKFFSPVNKSVCSEAEFSAAMGRNMSMFRESRELEESDGPEFRVQEVTVQGTQGLVIGDIYLNGELLFDSINESWVFADGNWWSVNSGEVPECSSRSPTPTPPGTLEKADTPVPVPGAFDGADMRALLSDEEVEAAIPLVVGNMLPPRDMRGLAGDEGMVGIDSSWGHLFGLSLDEPRSLMVIVTDFESPEILQQQIVLWTRDSMEFTEPTIGDGSLQGQEGDTVSVRFWKGDKTVLLSAYDLPGTPEVLDGLIALARLAESRLDGAASGDAPRTDSMPYLPSSSTTIAIVHRAASVEPHPASRL